VNLQHPAQLGEELPNDVLLTFQIPFDLQGLLHCSILAHSRLALAGSQIPFFLLETAVLLGPTLSLLLKLHYSRLWHGKLVPNGLAVFLHALGNDSDHLFIAGGWSLLAIDGSVDWHEFLFDLFAREVVLVAMVEGSLFRQLHDLSTISGQQLN
jgi:hypothetical protein